MTSSMREGKRIADDGRGLVQVASRKEDEWTTRKKRVEKALREAGWSPIADFVKGAKYDTASVREYETDEGPADYVLFHNGTSWQAYGGLQQSGR